MVSVDLNKTLQIKRPTSYVAFTGREALLAQSVKRYHFTWNPCACYCKLSLSSWFTSVLSIRMRYNKDILPILSPVKLNWISALQPRRQPVQRSELKDRLVQCQDSCGTFVSATNLTKNLNYQPVRWEQTTVHHGSANTNSLFLMRLHWARQKVTPACLRCTFNCFCLFMVNQAKRFSLYWYLFHKNNFPIGTF